MLTIHFDTDHDFVEFYGDRYDAEEEMNLFSQSIQITGLMPYDDGTFTPFIALSTVEDFQSTLSVGGIIPSLVIDADQAKMVEELSLKGEYLQVFANLGINPQDVYSLGQWEEI